MTKKIMRKTVKNTEVLIAVAIVKESENNAIAMGTRATTTRLLLSFKDIEDSLQTFSGDGKQNVRK